MKNKKILYMIQETVACAIDSLKVPAKQYGSWDKPVIFLLLLTFIGSPEIAVAAPWDGPLQTIIDLLTGTTARLAAILAIIVLGFMAMTGRMSWGIGGGIIGGIVLIFGAAWIADTFISSVT